jgi:hypothetical protein
MLQVSKIFRKLGNVDFCLAKNGKGCQQIVMTESNHCEKNFAKSFYFENTDTKIFAEILTDLHVTTLGFLIKFFAKENLVITLFRNQFFSTFCHW